MHIDYQTKHCNENFDGMTNAIITRSKNVIAYLQVYLDN